MKDKYLKHWRDVPILYSIAFILDLRAKLRGFNNMLLLLAKLTDTDYSAYFTEVRVELATMFNNYDSNFGAVKLRKPAQQPFTGRKKTV
jgi:hypothetical protein